MTKNGIDYLRGIYTTCVKKSYEMRPLREAGNHGAAMIECGLYQQIALIETIAQLERFKLPANEEIFAERQEDGVDCSSYHLENGKPRCWGTKNSEECSCNGNKKNCNFYTYDENGMYLGLK